MENTEPAFTASILQLDYHEFTAWVRKHRNRLDPMDREWLGAWESWDLACSPMDDEHRKRIRLGHSAGWWAARRP